MDSESTLTLPLSKRQRSELTEEEVQKSLAKIDNLYRETNKKKESEKSDTTKENSHFFPLFIS